MRIVAGPESEPLDVADGIDVRVSNADSCCEDCEDVIVAPRDIIAVMLGVNAPLGLGVIESEAALLDACVAVSGVDRVGTPVPDTLCEGLHEPSCDGVIVRVSPVVTDCDILLLGVKLVVGEMEGVATALRV